MICSCVFCQEVFFLPFDERYEISPEGFAEDHVQVEIRRVDQRNAYWNDTLHELILRLVFQTSNSSPE